MSNPEISKPDLKQQTEYQNALVSLNKVRESAFLNARMDYSTAVLRDTLLRPINEQSLNAYWEKIQSENNPEEATQKFHAEIKRRARAISSYVDHYAPGNLPINPDIVAQMEKTAQRFADALSQGPEYADLREALVWSLGMTMADAGSREAEKEKIQNTVAKYLASEKAEDFVAISGVLGFLEPAERREFLKGQNKAILIKICQSGAIPPGEAQDLLQDSQENISEEELANLGRQWGVTKEIAERAKFLATESIGAVNPLVRYGTVKNIFGALGYFYGAGTILLNSIFNIKEIMKDPTTFFSPHNLAAFGVMGGAYALTGMNQSFNEALASPSQREAWQTERAQKELRRIINASPTGWRYFFQGRDGKNETMVTNFYAFIIDNHVSGEKFSASSLNLESFTKFLASNEDYNEQKTLFEKMVAENSRTTSEKSLFEESLKKMAECFYILKISDRRKYNNVLQNNS